MITYNFRAPYGAVGLRDRHRVRQADPGFISGSFDAASGGVIDGRIYAKNELWKRS